METARVPDESASIYRALERENRLGLQTPVDETEMNILLAQTRGSWESRSIEEIEVELDRQRTISERLYQGQKLGDH